MSHRARAEEGWAMVTAVVLMTLMVSIGLALLMVVDTQTTQSQRERGRESAFNFSEGALNAQAFLLSRSWPGTSTSAYTASCTQGSADSKCPDPDGLRSNFNGGDFDPAALTWRLDVRDNGGAHETAWDDAALATQPGWDQNQDGEVWVRSQSTLQGTTRALVARIRMDPVNALPGGYGTLSGRFSTDLGAASNQVVASPLLTRLVEQDRLVKDGKIGIRCGLLTACVTGAFSALSDTQLDTLLANDVVQFGRPAAASDDVIAQLRQRAVDKGTYYPSLAANQPCPSPPAGVDNAIVFVEQVGDGDQPCIVTMSGGSTTEVRALVVASGRITLRGDGVYEGVVYGVNRQREALGDTLPAGAREVVRVEGPARVKGAVVVDGVGGGVGLYPLFDPRALIDTLPVCGSLPAVACTALKNSLRALGADALLTQLVTLVGQEAVVAGLAGQLGSKEMVQYDQAKVKLPSGLDAFGRAGAIEDSFREIPAP